MEAGMLRESTFGKLQPDQEIAPLIGAEEGLPLSLEPEIIAAENPLSEPSVENTPTTVIPVPITEIVTPELLIATSQTTLLPKIDKLVHPLDFSTSICTELDKVIEQTSAKNPYAVIVDLNSTQFNPWDMVKALKTTKSTKYIPMILIGVLERREKGLRVGAEDFLVKPIIQDEMEDIVARLESSSRTTNILLVDDNPENIRKFQNLVKNKKNIQLISSKTGVEGMKLMATLQPDRVIFNPLFNETDIFKLLETMYSDFRLRNIGITFMAGIDITEKQAATINQFNQMIFEKMNMSDVPLLKALENSIKK
jgi:PleD family two-component response regulator